MPASLIVCLRNWVSSPDHWAVLAGDRATAKSSVLATLALAVEATGRPLVYWPDPPPRSPRPFDQIPDRGTRLWLLDEWRFYPPPMVSGDLRSGIVAVERDLRWARSLMARPGYAPWPPEAAVAWVDLTLPDRHGDTVAWSLVAEGEPEAHGVMPRGPWAEVASRLSWPVPDPVWGTLYATPPLAGLALG